MITKETNGKWKLNIGAILQVIIILVPVTFAILTSFAKVGMLEEKIYRNEKEITGLNTSKLTEKDVEWLKTMFNKIDIEVKELRTEISKLTIKISSLEYSLRYKNTGALYPESSGE